MKIENAYLVNNPCFNDGRTIIPKGLMLHSVGCSQPSASVFINNWNKASYNRACVHAFIDANSGVIYQCLPWTKRAWHGGGSSNNTHIGVEMCEPSAIKYNSAGSAFTITDKTKAFNQCRNAYESAVELFAYLCKLFDLDPLKDGVIVSHNEGGKRGIASGHIDPEHLWNGLGIGYTMDGFRNDVAKKLGKVIIEKETTSEKKSYGECTVILPILKVGVVSDAVKALQTLLVGYGYGVGTAGCDGDFGNETKKAVMQYQARNKDKCGAADGIVGSKTWESLLGVEL